MFPFKRFSSHIFLIAGTRGIYNMYQYTTVDVTHSLTYKLPIMYVYENTRSQYDTVYIGLREVRLIDVSRLSSYTIHCIIILFI